MASYEMNEVMRRLTLATIIFLPLTLLTGYFGMNFENMWTVHHGHSDLVYAAALSSLALSVLNSPFARRFWIIALPLMAVVLPVFIVPDIKRMIHYVQKRILAKKIVKVRSPPCSAYAHPDLISVRSPSKTNRRRKRNGTHMHLHYYLSIHITLFALRAPFFAGHIDTTHLLSISIGYFRLHSRLNE
jgi:hypothetical protein